jgi:regulatory protein
MFPAEYWSDTDSTSAAASEQTGGVEDEKPKGRTRRKKIEDLPRDEQLEKAKDYAMYLLSASAKTRGQLEEKLLGKSYPEDVVSEALDRLTEVGLIDDEAYARAFVSSRHEVRGLSASAIRRELQRKGVDKEIADEAVTSIDSDDEWERAYDLVARKAKSMHRLDKDTKVRRLVSMLARKGYGGGIAYGVVKQFLADEGTMLDSHLDSGEE